MFLYVVPIKNMGCTKAPIDYVRNEPDDVLITKTPEVVAVSTEDKLDADHVIYGLVGMLHSSFDWRGISTSSYDNDLMVNTGLYEIWWLGKLTTFINT